MAKVGKAIETREPRRFDVICAGEPRWHTALPFAGENQGAHGPSLVGVTKMLRAAGMHVGWAAVLEDDRRARALLAEMAAIDVDVDAVKLAPISTDLVLVDAVGALSGPVSDRAKTHVQIPSSWSSQVLLLSGLSPLTSRLAAFCKAARRARRDGTTVVLDLVGNLRDWSGHDPRLISMVLREADVVCCSLFDLAVIGTDATAVRRAMKRSATLVLDDREGVSAVGTFGDVRVQASAPASATEIIAVSTMAAICVEHARPRGAGETPAGRWHRVLLHEAPKLTGSVTLTQRSRRARS